MKALGRWRSFVLSIFLELGTWTSSDGMRIVASLLFKYLGSSA